MDGVETRVVATEPVGQGMVALTLVAPRGFDAEPGQFILVRETIDGEQLGRHYTLSSPRVTETFEITVEVDADRTLSRWLATRQPGDAITMAGPFGRVHYEGEDPILLIAGGPGIGGALGIGEHARSAGASVTLVYHDDRVAHERRLSALSVSGGSVCFVRRRLREAVAATAADGVPFVIGYRDFIDDVRAAIEAAGGDPDAAKVENFGPR